MVKHGNPGVERNPIAWWVLGLCFVVDIIWVYRVWKEIASFTKKDINPVLKTVLMFVPILNIVIVYQMFSEISEMEEMVGIYEDERLDPIINLVMCFLFLIGIMFAQQHLNKVWQRA
ncbi:MAG: hypothetical protein JXA22_08595 [Candidatus Thermoplasmatota archaeon]|nr:hypothetical protein [Candidatus Thermoplasmatota archaeon]